MSRAEEARPVALITGASAGLGEMYARQLAARGHDLVLVARREERLQALARELESAKVHVCRADLSRPDAPGIVFEFARKHKLHVSLLVNNAGFGYFGDFSEQTLENALGMVDLHCRATVHLTRLFLPAMLEAGAGGVMNVASTAAFQPIPYFGVYAATKAFLLSFSEALAEEVRAQGVRVLAVCPGPTATEFGEVAEIPGISKLVRHEPAEVVVKRSLTALARGRSSMISGLVNTLSAHSVRFLPRAFVNRITGFGARRIRDRIRRGGPGGERSTNG